MNLTMQDNVFGRTKQDSVALPNPPLASHMMRVKQSNFGYFLGTLSDPPATAALLPDPTVQCARLCRGVMLLASTLASSSSPTPRMPGGSTPCAHLWLVMEPSPPLPAIPMPS